MNGPQRSASPGQARSQAERGQALIEFALLLPIFVIVMFIIVDFGVGFSRWIVLTNATREAARLGAASIETDAGDREDAMRARAIDTAGFLDDSDITVAYTDKEDNNSSAGDRGDSVIVRACYDYDFITPFMDFLPSDLSFDHITLSATSDMRLELPVSGASAGGPSGC